MSDENGSAPITADQNSGFDWEKQELLAKKENDAIEVHIRGVDEKLLYWNGEPVVIGVAGSHSDHYRRVEKQQRQKKLKRSSFTGESVYSEQIEKVAGATLYWRGFVSGGQPVPFTQSNVKRLYDRCPWVLEQITEAQNDHASFFSNGSKPPAITSPIEQDNES